MATTSDRFLHDFINSIMLINAKKKQFKNEDDPEEIKRMSNMNFSLTDANMLKSSDGKLSLRSKALTNKTT